MRESISVQTPATKCGRPVHCGNSVAYLLPSASFALWRSFLLETFTFNYIVGNQNTEQPRNKSAYSKRDCVSGSIATTCINLYLMCFKTLRPHSAVAGGRTCVMTG